jgi:LytR cell envelope-related transcriptional attenuator
LERARFGLTLVMLACACHRGERQRAFDIPGDRGPTLQVEVLNASGRDGLARIGTRVLREAGIDVVGVGNAPAAIGRLDSTRIVVRRGDASVGERLRRALGVGAVRLGIDSTRLLDASVLLGADFAPPVEFHP